MPSQHFSDHCLSTIARQGRIKLIRFFLALNISEGYFLIALAVIVGICAGLTAVLFRWMLDLSEVILSEQGAHRLRHEGGAWLLLLPFLPTIGGLIVGFLTHRYARETRGHGVPEVMRAIANEGGIIRPRVVLLKSLTSALCIGSGGSAGAEGPIIQIGSGVGSGIGQIFKMPTNKMKILVGCGAAAGLSAIFNAPMAGALFALEVIIGDFAIGFFAPVIVSSVLASVVSRAFLGTEVVFPRTPKYQLVNPLELINYLLLAILAGLVAVAFIKLLYAIEALFERLRSISPILKPAIGGFCVGLIGIYFPRVFGEGYEGINAALLGSGLSFARTVGLLIAKPVATSLSLGSGGSGGTFAPSLFIGAMLGSAFGHLVHQTFPTLTAGSGAYALVGMGAVVAAALNAPLSAMLMLFEITNNYRIILPLMFTVTISTLVARSLERESIYTLKLVRAGVRIGRGADISILERLTVAEAMNPECHVLKANTPLREIIRRIQRSRESDFPVIDDHGMFQGMVSFHDLRAVILDDQMHDWTVADDIASKEIQPLTSSDSLATALSQFAIRNIDTLPVVDQGRLIGVITRGDLMRRYQNELVLHTGRDASGGYHQ